ncbi:MAG: hypothetical protein MUP90_13760 [Gammaproteobacteria bacterium]|nr:hypothetical protein [Gammaproteobacteria bacterium]
MRRILVVSLMLILAGLRFSDASAETQDGLVKGTPEILGIFVTSDLSCPFEQQELEELVIAGMVDLQLRPKPFVAQELYLKVIVSCLNSGLGGGYLYNGQVDFVIAQSEGVMRPWQGIYGAFGIGQTDRILQVVGESVRGALRDYADSNPDLNNSPDSSGSQ